MTCVTLYREQNIWTGLCMTGHSGLAPAGEDILCAALTSALRMLECALSDVLALGPEVTVEDETATICIRLPVHKASDPTCQTVFQSFYLHIRALRDEYPQLIKLTEV